MVKDSAPVATVKVDSTRKNLVYPRPMSITHKTAYDSYFLRWNDSMYYCTYKGRIECEDTTGNHKSFILDIKAEYLIDAIYLQPIADNRFFVAWQETDHTGVVSYFAVFDRGKDKPNWKRSFKAPAPGQPVVDGHDVFVTARGVVAKYDLLTGDPYWVHDSLFDPMKLNFKKIERPLIFTSTVCFFDLPIRGQKNHADSIWINDKTGKILR